MKKASKKKSNDLNPFPGHPLYLRQDDIFNRERRLEKDIEDILEGSPGPHNRAPVQRDEELKFRENETEELMQRSTPVDFSGMDLDVPGAELDDKQEEIGNEDEENNIYSLGGDNHNDLEERNE